MQVTYLYHSGFAVDTGDNFLIFDYYRDLPRGAGLSKGVVRPADLAGRRVTVFASHHHPDHFNRRIFSWRKELPGIRYVLSSDIKDRAEAAVISPGQRLCLDGLTVRALESTDEGVAFLVQTNSGTVFHAGDLNWWYWAGEPEAENQEMGRRYREQIDLLRGERIDVVFVPVDPRLGGQYLYGLGYLMTALSPRMAFPMHFGEDLSVTRRLQEDPQTAAYRERVAVIERRGQRFALF